MIRCPIVFSSVLPLPQMLPLYHGDIHKSHKCPKQETVMLCGLLMRGWCGVLIFKHKLIDRLQAS